MISDDTIYALSTGAGKAGIAVVRISGSNAESVVDALTGRPPGAPRTAARRSVRHPHTGEILDRGLLIWFPGPASFTGEDAAEFHIHGGHAVVAALLEALAATGQARLASAGEFTRRAFHNGKLDLTEVEGLADLVDAETEGQRRQALRQYTGALGGLVDGWRARLIRALAQVEADIDFSDEADVPADGLARTLPDLMAMKAEMATHLADRRRGERMRDGISVAIVGQPNVGKSSILNALAQRDAAIVADTAGTTRDVIEVRLDLGGVPFVLADTAGLRSAEAADAVEAEGMRRARRRASEADIRLLVMDGADGRPVSNELLSDADLVLVNKSDLPGWRAPACLPDRSWVAVSATKGTGVAEVLDCLSALGSDLAGVDEAPLLTRHRHREALDGAVAALGELPEAGPPELAAEHLRVAARELGRITGAIDVEDILDAVFRDFCIGK